MKTAVRYQSKSGNTEKVARVIAKELGVEASNVGVPLPESVDVLFLGGAIYAGSINKDLKKFLKEFRPGQAKTIALFSTAMGEKHIGGKVSKLLKGKEVALYGEEFHAQAKDLDASLEGAAAFAKKAAAE